MNGKPYRPPNYRRLPCLIQQFDPDTNDFLHKFTSRHAHQYGRIFADMWDVEDFYQEAMVAILEALPRLRDEDPRMVRTFLCTRIRGQMVDMIRRELARDGKTNGKKPSGPAVKVQDDEALDVLMRVVQRVPRNWTVSRRLITDLIWDCLMEKRVQPRYVMAYLLYFFGDYRMRDLAEELNVTESRISQVVKMLNGKLYKNGMLRTLLDEVLSDEIPGHRKRRGAEWDMLLAQHGGTSTVSSVAL